METVPHLSSEVAAQMSACDLLQGLGATAMETLAASARVRELLDGDVLLAAGTKNENLYLVLAGRLRVYLNSALDLPLAIIEAGESVGELSVIDGAPTSAMVIADGRTRILEVPENVLWSLVHDSHPVAINLLQALAHRLRQGNSVIHRIQALLREYEYDATVDPLTGLYNRRWLDRTLGRLMQRATSNSSAFSVLMIDIDAFKQYNDQHGHLAGDRALLAVARCLSLHLRPGDTIARFGGEELLALLPGSDHDDASAVAERLRAAIESLAITHSDGSELPGVTISVGVASMVLSDRPDDLIGKADAALYRAKAAGRNCVSA